MCNCTFSVYPQNSFYDEGDHPAFIQTIPTSYNLQKNIRKILILTTIFTSHGNSFTFQLYCLCFIRKAAFSLSFTVWNTNWSVPHLPVPLHRSEGRGRRMGPGSGKPSLCFKLFLPRCHISFLYLFIFFRNTAGFNMINTKAYKKITSYLLRS